MLQPADEPGEIARDVGAGALGMAGGDGSLAPVAAIERDLPFVCVLIDGEPVGLELPVRLAVEPRALRLLAAQPRSS